MISAARNFFPAVIITAFTFVYVLLIYSNSWAYQRQTKILVATNGGKYKVSHSHNICYSITDACMNDYNFHIAKGTKIRQNKNHPLDYSPNLRNPCWFEYFNLSTLENFKNNPYTKMSKDRHVDDKLSRVANVLSKRLDRKLPHHNVRLRCLPYFIIIGQVKCGTTDLFHRLELHPQIEMGMLKEPDWWTRSNTGKNGKFLQPTLLPFESFVDLNGLAAIEIEKQIAAKHCQRSTKPISIIGEGSVATLSDQNWRQKSSINGQSFKQQNSAAGYVRWVMPHSKIIILLRNPVNRLFSDYLFFDKTGFVSQKDFHHRVEQTLSLYNDCKQEFGDCYCINDRSITKKFKVGLHRGLYSILLEDWLATYSKQNILIIKTEEYAANETAELRKVYQFLNLDNLSRQQEESIMKINIRNKGKKQIGEMWNITRQILTKFYQPYNIQLAKQVNDNKFLWN